MPTPVTVRGVTYRSLNAAANEFNVPYYAVFQRVKFGWSLEEALELVPRANQHGTMLEVEGTMYSTIKEAAEAYKVNATTVRARLAKGWTIRESLQLDVREPKVPNVPKWEVSVNGVDYHSVADAARKLGKDYAVVSRRIGLGWTIEEAFDPSIREPKHGYPGIVYKIENTINGKCYVGVSMRPIEERWEQHQRDALIKPTKNNPDGLYHAIITHGSAAFTISLIQKANNHVEMQTLEVKWVKELNTLAPNGYNLNIGGSGSMPNINHAIAVNGKSYPSIACAIRELKITIAYQTIIQRLKDGWTPEQAFGFESHETNTENWGKTQRAITINGITYRCLAEACRQIPGSPDVKLVQRRLTLGWTPEEAFNLTPHNDQRGKHPNSSARDVLNDKATSRNTSGYRGIAKHQKTGKWQASFSHRGRRIFVGLFDDAETANHALQNARQNAG